MAETNNPPPDVENITVDKWCYTQVPMIKCNYIWTISNFSQCRGRNGDHISSSTFFADENDEIKWCIKIYPEGTTYESRDYVSLYLACVSCENSREFKAKFRFSILNADKEEVKGMESSRPYIFFPRKDWGFQKFIKRDYLLDEANGLVPDEKLTIFCEVSFPQNAVSISGQRAIKFEVPECRLADDFGLLLESQKLHDVKFTVAGNEFLAHKAILIARSSVFSTMFEHETEDKKQTQVEINDIEQDVFREILRFIYTGKVENIEKIAKDLMLAADKYALERLKIMCEEAIFKTLTKDNAADILQFAELHNADKLKQHVIEYNNMPEDVKINLQTTIKRESLKKDSDISTPLHDAVRKGLKSEVQRLLSEENVDVEKTDGYLTPLQLAFYRAISENNDDNNSIVDLLYTALKKKFVEGKVWNNNEDENGLSYLHIAATRNDMEMAKKFLGEDFKGNPLRQFLLGYSFFTLDYDINKKPVDVNIEIHCDSQMFPGYTPLHFAVKYGHYEIAEFFIAKGADVNKDSADGTPLHIACELGHWKLIELLLKHGGNVKIARKSDGITPIHAFVSCFANNGLSEEKDAATILEFMKKLV